jgi:4-hydroxybutyryl-CoA dehydratase/vinylacetyl-CoA-Delta-isomerase
MTHFARAQRERIKTSDKGRPSMESTMTTVPWSGIACGSVMTASSTGDLENPVMRGLLRKYMVGSSAYSGESLLRLSRMARDITATSFRGWRQVTTAHSGGGLRTQRPVTRRHYDFGAAKALALGAADMSAGDLT